MLNISELIRSARGDQDQTSFGVFLGKSQTQISKYENGAANPPRRVIEQCMAILEKNSPTEADDISAEKLAERVKTILGQPQHSLVRKSIAVLLEGLR